MRKNLLPIVSLLCLSTFSVFGQEEERFTAGQFEVSPFATYVDKYGDDWGAGAALSYFLTDRIGIGASTYWTDFEGTFIDNLTGEGYLRLPVLKIVAPYGVVGAGYEFESEKWFGTVGFGVDFRPFKNISAFSDVQWRFVDELEDGVFLRLGVRFAFN